MSEFGSESFTTSVVGCIDPSFMIVVIDRVGQLFAGKHTLGEHDFICSFIVVAKERLLMLDKLITAVIGCAIESEIGWIEVTKQTQLTKES